MKNISEKLILALDVPTKEEALDRVRRCLPYVKTFKVGKQLFTKEGPSIVRDIQELGGDIFLDLKFHDIPNTVASATESVLDLGVFMFNVHVLGGMEMMKASRRAIEKRNPKKRPLLIGVTVLTSMEQSDLNMLGIHDDPKKMVLKYAKLAKEAGLDGVVCSVNEVADIKRALGNDFLTVTPGIRLDKSSVEHDDQKRVATVKTALEQGSDYIVIGRSLFTSKDPMKLLQSTLESYPNA